MWRFLLCLNLLSCEGVSIVSQSTVASLRHLLIYCCVWRSPSCLNLLSCVVPVVSQSTVIGLRCVSIYCCVWKPLLCFNLLLRRDSIYRVGVSIVCVNVESDYWQVRILWLPLLFRKPLTKVYFLGLYSR